MAEKSEDVMADGRTPYGQMNEYEDDKDLKELMSMLKFFGDKAKENTKYSLKEATRIASDPYSPEFTDSVIQNSPMGLVAGRLGKFAKEARTPEAMKILKDEIKNLFFKKTAGSSKQNYPFLKESFIDEVYHPYFKHGVISEDFSNKYYSVVKKKRNKGFSKTEENRLKLLDQINSINPKMRGFFSDIKPSVQSSIPIEEKIGHLGDFVVDPVLRLSMKDALDTPVFISRKTATQAKAGGEYNPSNRNPFLHPDDPHSKRITVYNSGSTPKGIRPSNLKGILLHEAIHATRDEKKKLLGNVGNLENYRRRGFPMTGDYYKRPHEVSAFKGQRNITTSLKRKELMKMLDEIESEMGIK